MACTAAYHGEVMCALGGRLETRLGRPETDQLHGMTMNLLGLGLDDAKYYKYALSVREAELAMKRRLGVPEENLLGIMANIGGTYENLGQLEKGLGINPRHSEKHGALRRRK